MGYFSSIQDDIVPESITTLILNEANNLLKHKHSSWNMAK